MNCIFKILAILLPTRSVDGIVKLLGVLATKLAEAEKLQHDKVATINADISLLTTQRSAAIEEAARAARVSAKIEDLIA